ncbi:Dihydroorotate dehydrogenase (quinone) [Pseudovibrio axinellae]|uniref:Dihydroorotate dehydrogenase (quinone) n=1 Tax=Pseudovibrio axinellae TaxID=989403 RepID=A0A165YJY6_9HYPH|nr:quinone-dependent dihydroorotate dehydrogenase [Pseudovibrio axinellae]KZL18907.1 Dihydroorotate dehydrogenase (quinone) [Pseudovibrio axinellae]SEP88181.1 dihydroorotate oxidase A [Pseudovibrio axinellae]
MSIEEMINKIGIRALHCLDPETSHNATIKMLSSGLAPTFAQVEDPALEYKWGDLTFKNPVGMAAGFDKNAQAIKPLMKLGFGHVEVGTVTPLPQEGNPKPRNFRLSADRAVINRYGFNNDGHDVVYERIRKTGRTPGVLGINVGANKLSDDRVADYVLGVKRFAELAGYLTANISSPNTPGLRDLQERGALANLLAAIIDARREQEDRLGRKVPVLLKIAPDVTETALKEIAEEVMTNNVDGMIISNTTITRPPTLKDQKQAKEAGGLSGAPLFERATVTLAKARRAVGPDLPLFGVGGVDTPEKAAAKIFAGANQIQLYSGMVYEGQTLVSKINQHLSRLVATRGVSNLQELVGIDNAQWAEKPLD